MQKNSLVKREEEKFIRRQKYENMKQIVVDKKEEHLLAQKARQQKKQ